MDAAKRIIFSNYYNDSAFEEARQSLAERTGIYPADLADEDIWDEYYALIDDCWDSEKSMLEDFFDGTSRFLLTGTIGRWNGPAEGGFTFSTVDELSRAWEDCDYFELFDENGHLFINASHHDGTNHFEVRQLTEKGIDYERSHPYADLRQLHSALWKRYSRLPHYAHRVFGRPKREYTA